MDTDENLMALKKAYADIIMDISKEAAARVMACEKKSVRNHHELKATKEEGVRMLIRLKKMMDAQVSEAEAAALNQQKKIEELEAQLQEAEDIVRDLRAELAEVQSELGKINSYHMVKPENTDSAVDIISSYQSWEYLPPNKPSVAFTATVSEQGPRNECSKCSTKIVCTCGAYIRNRDLPSIILRGKDDRLYRNGCTQRIRAYERNRDSCISEEAGRVTEEKNGIEQMQARQNSEPATSGGKILTELEKKLLPEINFGCFQSFPRKRKRDVRRKKSVTPLAGKEDSQDDANTMETCGSTTPMDAVNEKLVPLGLAAKSSEILPNDSKMEVGTIDEPLHSLESNSLDITKGIASLPVRQREFKYTFQRKRKRQALVVSEVNGSENKTGDEENGDLKQEKPEQSLSKESSRDSRQLVQIAQQLISLSEKKWWR